MKLTTSIGPYAGVSLSEAGDVNGDGYDDLLIGSVPYTNGFVAQKTYILFGRRIIENGESMAINLATYKNGIDGIISVGGGIVVSGVGSQ
jgi:hypothetical protein